MTIAQRKPDMHLAFLEGGPKKLLIGGRWVDAASGRTFETIDPSTGQVLARVAEGDREDIDAAVNAARRAFNGPWSKFKPYDRQQIILKLADLVDKHFDELSLIDTLDMGAPISRTRASRRRLLGLLRYYAGMATALHGETIDNSMPGDYVTYTLKEPVGVVGAITPWNGPLVSWIWKIGPVLATGCTAVLKPAEESPLSALRMGELLLEAGLPDGVVNIVTGFGETAGGALASHPDVDKIAFTGSFETGQKIVQASVGNLKRVTLELGGKSPDIVFADVDLDLAVPGAAMGCFGNSGQVCSAGTRLFVEDKIYDEFMERVAAFSRTLKVGNSLDPEVQIGPLVSEQQLNRVSSYLDIGQQEGAKLLSGGRRLTEDELASGYFIPPTVFAGVRDDMRIAQEEIFGPVVSSLPFSDLEEVARRANNTMYGLGSGVWTNDVRKAHYLAKAIRAGSVWINCYQMMDPAMPFGGYKRSGYGRESGVQQFNDYLNVKSVLAADRLMTSKLFSPITLSGVTFPNRVVISPMCQYSAPDGAASDWHMAHLGQFAMSRAGLLLLEATAVEPAGRISPLCLALYSDAQEAALARVVTMLRYAGGDMPLGIQLGHAGRKGSCHMPWDGGHGLKREEGGWPVFGPSALPYDDRRAVPEALDEAGLERIAAAFVDAAERADRIGFDLVEYHCAHGYLLHSFLSAQSNRRQDGYGGSLENRMRFPLAVARRLRQAWPARKALGARLDAEDATDAASLAETIAYARELKAIGFDYVCLSRGSLSGDQKIVSWPGYLLPLAAALRAATGLVTQAVGLIVDPRMAEEAVASGQVDMVALARGFLDDPRWAWHAAEALGAELSYPPQYRGADPSLWKGAALRPRAHAAG